MDARDNANRATCPVPRWPPAAPRQADDAVPTAASATSHGSTPKAYRRSTAPIPRRQRQAKSNRLPW